MPPLMYYHAWILEAKQWLFQGTVTRLQHVLCQLFFLDMNWVKYEYTKTYFTPNLSFCDNEAIFFSLVQNKHLLHLELSGHGEAWGMEPSPDALGESGFEMADSCQDHCWVWPHVQKKHITIKWYNWAVWVKQWCFCSTNSNTDYVV